MERNNSLEETLKTVRQEINNEEFLKRVMSFSKFGAIIQPFIIEAIRAYCEAIVKAGKPENDSFAFISPVLWYEIAVDVKKQFDKQYGVPNGDTRSQN
jgi:hypothetical protein